MDHHQKSKIRNVVEKLISKQITEIDDSYYPRLVIIKTVDQNIHYRACFNQSGELSIMNKLEEFYDHESMMNECQTQYFPANVDNSMILDFSQPGGLTLNGQPVSISSVDKINSQFTPLHLSDAISIKDKYFRLCPFFDYKHYKGFIFQRNSSPVHISFGLLDCNNPPKLYIDGTTSFSYPDALAIRQAPDGQDMEIFLAYDEIETTIYSNPQDINFNSLNSEIHPDFEEDYLENDQSDYTVSLIMHHGRFGWVPLNTKSQLNSIIQYFHL